MKKIITLIIFILIPNLFGLLGIVWGNISNSFYTIVKPDFTPPGVVFSIVWIILYTLMGISSYIVFNSNNKEKNIALIIYIIQLILNSLWTLFFFNLKWFLFAFIWIILIIIITLIMIDKFYKIEKISSILQVPYLIWLIFASILNFYIFLLN